MTIRAQFRITALACLGLGAAAAGILLLANHRIDEQMRNHLLADQISKGVYELAMMTRSYLAGMDEGPKVQWEQKYASLRRLIRQAMPPGAPRNENLESISQSFDQKGELFERIVELSEKNRTAAVEDIALQQEVVDRLASRAIAKGQEMVHHAFLMTQESNRSLSIVKRNAIILVLACILLIVFAIFATYQLLRNRILSEIQLLQKGTELVADGDLGFSLAVRDDSEMGRLAAAFNRMTLRLGGSERQRESYIRKLAASNKELEDFAFVASHDLQEPLRKIRAFGDRLQEKAGDGLGAEAQGYLLRMRTAAERMQDLIHDLLSYSRVTNRPQPFTTVALAEVLNQAAADLAVRFEQTGGRVEAGDLPAIECSPNQIRQLFQNLLSNSLKFCGEDPPVIRVSATRADDQAGQPSVVIRVEDNGIGFDEKHRERVFQPFQRLHGRSEYEGTGMGLAICRKIVERHHGTITAQASVGRGAAFVITLPMEQPRQS